MNQSIREEIWHLLDELNKYIVTEYTEKPYIPGAYKAGMANKILRLLHSTLKKRMGEEKLKHSPNCKAQAKLLKVKPDEGQCICTAFMFNSALSIAQQIIDEVMGEK